MILPQHLAIIMDGNGRWAQSKGFARIVGHQQGVKTVRLIVDKCAKLGLRYLTLYAFSSENWKRPAAEVEALMSLLGSYLSSEMSRMREHKIRLQVIGDLTKLPQDIVESIQESVRLTENNTGMTLTLALSYGSRNEIVRATQSLCADVVSGALDIADIDEKLVLSYLDTKSIPDPDLLIRTSGEMRISNFLLWQLAYAELYFCSCFWPEFDEKQLLQALTEYSGRCRRFGGVLPTINFAESGDPEEISH